VLAHRLDAPMIRGDVAQPLPNLTDWEKPLFERITPGVPPAPPCPADETVEDGTELGFGLGARAVLAPGHTDGSIAIHLPEHRVLFTGDTIARLPGPEPIVGVFNVDRERTVRSLHLLAGLDSAVARFGTATRC
jgi:glyoxylase-like metal-dependent hydrolase (beta-lactamase superfamily II)